MKYDFELDLSSKNSVSLIINKVRKKGSTVLEFGPAAGRMTRYLKENLNCKVYIVEIDQEAAQKAATFAEEAVIGNIEDYVWYERFKDLKFDYIIFADVLEHLYYPQTVLKKCAELLNEDGSILTSIPNIAHNSVIIDLLQNKFEYRKTGLLDDTHIRFFTYSSLKNMFRSCTLDIVEEEVVLKSVGQTELDNYFDNVPRSVAKFLKNRTLGDIYQFVFELKSQSAYSLASNKVSNIQCKGQYYFTQLYMDCGDGFTENQSVRLMSKSNTVSSYSFNVSGFRGIRFFRFDPWNTNCLVKIHNIICIDTNDSRSSITNYKSNANLDWDGVYLFDHDDPQIYFASPQENLKEIIIEMSVVDYEIDNLSVWIDFLAGERNAYQESLENMKQEGSRIALLNSELEQRNLEFVERINHLNDELAQQEKTLNDKNLLLTERIKQLTEASEGLQNELSIKEMQVESNADEINQLNVKLREAEETISQIQSTKLWKIYSKLK